MAEAKSKPKGEDRADEGLSSQPQFASYSQASVKEGAEAHEVEQTIPAPGPITLQERGVASKGKPDASPSAK